VTVGNWRDRFVDAGKAGWTSRCPARTVGSRRPSAGCGTCEQLKLVLAEATVQLRIWQKGSEFVDSVPSPTSRP
jgi:transposase